MKRLAILLLCVNSCLGAMPLRQSTAVTVKVGPMVDAGDLVTPETGLILHAAHIRLSKNGGDFAAKNDATALVHDENGYYDCVLDATDTGTLGLLTLAWTDPNAAPIRQDYEVMPARVWDSTYGTSRLDALVNTTIATATDANDFTLTAGQDVNDAYWMAAVMVQDANDGHSEVRWINRYVTSRAVTVDEPFSFTPAPGDLVWVLDLYGGLIQRLRTLLDTASVPTFYIDDRHNGGP